MGDGGFTQIYAFAKRGKITPIVSIDGWLSIINRQSDYDGLEVEDSPNLVTINGVRMPEYCKVKIYRKNLSRPIVISEFAAEAFNPDSTVWKHFPRRMLRHKAIIQCARIAFSISGIYDKEEAMNAVEDDEDVLDVSDMPEDDLPIMEARPRRRIGYQTKAALDAALDSAVKTAVARSNWGIAEKWVNDNLEGKQRDYGLVYVDDRRSRLENKPEAAAVEEERAPQNAQSVPVQQEKPVEASLPPVPPEPHFEDLPF